MNDKVSTDKPDKDGFFWYYIIQPVEIVREGIWEFLLMAWRYLTGAWWCGYCQAYHGRRVHRYTVYSHKSGCTDLEYDTCSLGRDRFREGTWIPWNHEDPVN